MANWADCSCRIGRGDCEGPLSTSRAIGVNARMSGQPSRPPLVLDVLKENHIRQAIARLVALHVSPALIELACTSTDARLKIAIGQKLGRTAPLSTCVCDAVIQRRHTLRGEVVRIRSGKRLQSVVIPRHISSTAVSNGTMITTAPIIGLVCQRLVQAFPCQMNLFTDDRQLTKDAK